MENDGDADTGAAGGEFDGLLRIQNRRYINLSQIFEFLPRQRVLVGEGSATFATISSKDGRKYIDYNLAATNETAQINTRDSKLKTEFFK